MNCCISHVRLPSYTKTSAEEASYISQSKICDPISFANRRETRIDQYYSVQYGAP
jgi:hypothetical protein